MTPFQPATSGGRDPFASFDLDSLVTGAARLRPERAALRDSFGARLSYAELDERTTSLAAHFADLGLKGGECLLIAGGARVSTVVAMIAGVRAGLDVALAPLHLTLSELVFFATQTKAAALAADASYGELAPVEYMFATAMEAPCVRLVCSLGAGAADGAVDLDSAQLKKRSAPARLRSPGACRVITRSNGQMVAHDQHSLVAAALELLSRARIGMRDPIVSTLAPVSFSALAAGPFAALLAGCSLHLHGPFDGEQFLAECDACAPAHLVAPRALALALATDGLLESARLASLMIKDGVAGLSLSAQSGAPVIDLDGLTALAPAPQPIMIRRDEPALAGATKAG